MVVLNWIAVLQYLFAFAMEYFPAALCSRCFNKEEAVHEFSTTASDNKKAMNTLQFKVVVTIIPHILFPSPNILYHIHIQLDANSSVILYNPCL